MIADEVDALDLGGETFVDLEHHVHAVLLELDDLRLNRRSKPALTTINVENALNVRHGAGPGIDRARLELDFALQRRVINLAVALEGNLADHRVLVDAHDDGGAFAIDRNVREQPSCEQRPQGRIRTTGVVSVTDVELKIGANSLGLDTPITFDPDLADHGLGLRSSR